MSTPAHKVGTMFSNNHDGTIVELLAKDTAHDVYVLKQIYNGIQIREPIINFDKYYTILEQHKSELTFDDAHVDDPDQLSLETYKIPTKNEYKWDKCPVCNITMEFKNLGYICPTHGPKELNK